MPVPVPQKRFVADRSTEYAAWLASGPAPQYDALRAFLVQEKEALAKVERLRKGRETDDFLFAKLKLRAHDGNHSEVAQILSSPANCFAGFGGTAGTSRASLLSLWAQVSLAAEEAKVGHPLTALEARRLRRKLGGLSRDGAEKGGTWGPPNLGVWFGPF